MRSLPLIAKIIFLLPVILIGLGHFSSTDDMARMVPSWLPGPTIWVYITGVCLLLAALAIILNRKAKLASLLLAILLTAFAVFIHLPGFLDGEMAASASFIKDLGLAGGSLFIYTQSKD